MKYASSSIHSHGSYSHYNTTLNEHEKPEFYNVGSALVKKKAMIREHAMLQTNLI